MIDLVFWSFVVAVLPMLLALGTSMLSSAAGSLARSTASASAWHQPARLRSAPHSLNRSDRSRSYFRDV